MKFAEQTYRCKTCGEESTFTDLAREDGLWPAQSDMKPYCQACKRRGVLLGLVELGNMKLVAQREVEFTHDDYRKRRGYTYPNSSQKIQRPVREYTDEERAQIAANQARREQEEQEVLEALPSVADKVMRTRYGDVHEYLRERRARGYPGGEPGGAFRAEQEKAKRGS